MGTFWVREQYTVQVYRGVKKGREEMCIELRQDQREKGVWQRNIAKEESRPTYCIVLYTLL